MQEVYQLHITVLSGYNSYLYIHFRIRIEFIGQVYFHIQEIDLVWLVHRT